MNPKKVILLGSTGSIGQSTLKVAENLPDKIRLVGLAAHQNGELLTQQIKKTGAQHVCLYDSSKVSALKQAAPHSTTIYQGPEGLLELIQKTEADAVLVAIVGTAGLHPTLAAIEKGREIAIASKEILVMAGEIVMQRAREKGVPILPVDSEHNAIFQCLQGHSTEHINRIILTASGGPFRKTPASQLVNVTPQEALNHPNWDMGSKITIDSATLFNKGLEMIEAKWLFDLEPQQIDVVIHPQSIVHSMVEYIDGSILAQMSHSDMCFPIQYALTWPERTRTCLKPLDFASLSALEFAAPRHDDFPALTLARKALEQGGTLPAIMNAANEVAVAQFLQGTIRFVDIWEIVSTTMHAAKNKVDADLEDILEADTWARQEASRLLPTP